MSENSAAKAIWRKHGGTQHGPIVEHYSIEEQAFYRFASELTRTADAENQRLRAEVEALREALGRIASDEGRWSDPDSPQRIAREALTRKVGQ